jgi:hypothetical protein
MSTQPPNDIKLYISPVNFLSPSVHVVASAPPAIEDECIICLQPNNLIENKICACKYKYHQECFNNLVNNDICMLCKKKYTAPIIPETNDCCAYICVGLCILFIVLGILLGVSFSK